ncbi:sugar phosphorylase [Clostridium sp. Marseille-Q2269]|uniref:sugar phosphorylase n=1 Tax=Clostridium sp. Marseille-Q2269 TaxID=2942205 RepID=UPI0020746F49|nr:sugar phosphorylase [Clostridium sp. Marseille-Q2269]
MNKNQLLQSLKDKLKYIYEDKYNEEFILKMEQLITQWENKQWEKADKITEKNIYLITYGDSIYEKHKNTLRALNKFLKEQVEDSITDVHLLPMFEYTSDDGFSVVDYKKIDEKLGHWQDIDDLSKNYRLMFDFVANHISKSSEWFKGYINDEQKYKNFFIPYDENFDTSKVVRPRTSPLFHKYKGKNGEKTAWTTFSQDQVDINISHFPVLVEMTNIILMYANRGATSIRLDAIGFLWKESGTSCMHLKRTHEIIKLWRCILDYFKPNTQIITETNVPHKENISYFGNTKDEANMVYQFSLPPLVLYTFTTHDSSKLTKWAKTIDVVSNKATYFNFLSSHDGVGMRPTEGILTEDEKQILVDKTLENGGRVSYKTNKDNTKSVYELNINYHDALINKNEDTSEDLEVKKILAANSILLSCIGVPAIYYHSLLGSRNDEKGMQMSGINRRINREKLCYDAITKELKTNSRRNRIFNGLKYIINLRKKESAFSPYASQQVLDLNKNVFALERINEDTKEKITFIVNVSCEDVEFNYDIKGENIVTREKINGIVKLKSYQFVWIK